MNNYRYTGEQYDPNVGFYYLRARYYDPSVARLVTADPWDGTPFDPLTLHKYVYARGNPVSFADPTGLFAYTIMEVMVMTTIIYILAMALICALQVTAGRVTDALSLFSYSERVKWHGEMIAAEVGKVVGGAVLWVELQSQECHNDEVYGLVRAYYKFRVYTWGLEFSLPPGAFTSSAVTMDSPAYLGLDASAFTGSASFISAAVAFGPRGESLTKITMGMARGDASGWVPGFDAGVNIMYGYSRPYELILTPCSPAD